MSWWNRAKRLAVALLAAQVWVRVTCMAYKFLMVPVMTMCIDQSLTIRRYSFLNNMWR